MINLIDSESIKFNLVRDDCPNEELVVIVIERYPLMSLLLI